MRILDIVEGTSVDGPGLRTAIYFAGCHHKCPGCHNPQSWDMEGGRKMTVSEVMTVINDNGFNVTFTGGDPLYSLDEVLPLAKTVKESGYTLWCYTGFCFEEIVKDESLRRILDYADVVVDGPYVESQRDVKLRFRGSANQRLVDVKRSLETSSIVTYGDN
ncbi:MAG: anaerobic ribonucleoside-triphosphate reductase activating protein [Lachnoclostridium sp.]|nr:anaerobic ribonucleoside-triphosphate reductase activating protein [Lachnoclostridium sp.]